MHRTFGSPPSHFSLQFFEGYTIPDVKDGVHILRMADGRSAGEAFVQLATDDGV